MQHEVTFAIGLRSEGYNLNGPPVSVTNPPWIVTLVYRYSKANISAGEESHKYQENYFYNERLASACLCYTYRVGNPESRHIHVLEPERASGLREYSR